MPLGQRIWARDTSPFSNPNIFQLAVLTAGSPIGTAGRVAISNPISSGIVIRLRKLFVTQNRGAGATGEAFRIGKGPAAVTGGALVTAADIPKKDTLYSNAKAAVRAGQLAVAGTVGWWHRLGGSYGTTTGFGGPAGIWTAWDLWDAMYLYENESVLIYPAFSGIPDADQTILVTLEWEEN